MRLPDNGRKRGNAAFSVFDHICLHPGATRADAAAETGLSVTSVGTAVDLLIDEGLVYAFSGESSGGRPAEALFPSRSSVALFDVRERNARVLILDLSGNISFFEERPVGSRADVTDAVRDLVCRAADSQACGEDGLFAAAFASAVSRPVDRDAVLYARSRLSPLFVRSFDPDLLSARAASFEFQFDDAVFCSVSRDGAAASYLKKKDGDISFGDFSELISSYGTGFGRTFAACRDEKEAGETLADALFNTLAIVSPDLLLFEISGGAFSEKLGDRVRRALSGKLPRVPEIKTLFRNEERLRSEMLSLLRRSPFEKEGGKR